MNWEREINIIRGKNLVGAATKEDIDILFKYLDKIEFSLDQADSDDMLGPGGWRDFCGVDV
jgi:hypothetical protein